MTPLHIKIAVHYFCHPYPYAEHDAVHRYSRATSRYKADLVRAGLLVPRDVHPGDANTAEYDGTPGLRQYMDALCTVPLPTLQQAWIHPMVGAVAAEQIDRG